MQKNSHENEEIQEEGENRNLFGVYIGLLKEYLFKRNYELTSNSVIGIGFATFISLVPFVQEFLMYSLPYYNPIVIQGSGIYTLVGSGSFLILELQIENSQNDENGLIIMALLLVLQVTLFITFLTPFKSKQANLIVSKYSVHLLSSILYIPSVYHGTKQLLTLNWIHLSLGLLGLTLLNKLLYVSLHFELSIVGQNTNILVRNPVSTTKQIFRLTLLMVFLVCRDMLYPMSLLLYLLTVITVTLIEAKEFCVGLTYHREYMDKLLGVGKIFSLSVFLCYLIVIATEVALVYDNMVTFILAFFLFSTFFFLIFKKHAVKNIVIDSEEDSQVQKITFIVWYFNCFRNRAEKKNELYLSSLMKNHLNECTDSACLCRFRNEIYDPSADIFGEASWQPHRDTVFIKHFFLKLLKEGCKRFPKSNELLFLLAFYNLQVLHFIPPTIELIKQLKKKSLKKNLSFSENYILFCLTKSCYSKIEEINLKKGNLNLEKAKEFDRQMIELKETIKLSVKTFTTLWKNICSANYNQEILVNICKVALEIMFKIERYYNDIKKTNEVSTELRELMLLYGKYVAHDVHLISEVRKEIKVSLEKTFLSNSIQIKNINLFSQDTMCLLTTEITKIRWATKNCHLIFGYTNRDQFIKLRINDLMPKYFSENHDRYIEKWIESGHASKLNRVTYLWGSNKAGYCFGIALYIKIIPLPKEQDFAFFGAIEKIDVENQILTTEEGQILGSGKMFASTIKCSQKYLQDFRPNIQTLIPSTFQFYLDRFFPQRTSYLNNFQKQDRLQGYFPRQLETVLKSFVEEKQAFLSRNSKKLNFYELYCNFIKEKMQEMTVYMDGEYISFSCNIHEVSVIKGKKILLFKITGFKKNNVERYYNDLEKTIAKIEALKKQYQSQKKIRSIKNNKSCKKSMFKVFLNPKRVKKILNEENQQRNQDNENWETMTNFRRNESMVDNFAKDRSNSVNTQERVIGYRKKLALNAQHEIKNERAKYNIWKMKKCLLEEGVISHYTYNMLVGKSNDFQSIKSIGLRSDNVLEMETSPFDEEVSNEDMDSECLSLLNNQNNGNPNGEQQQDNETFNSATSSAAFISMTNSIKMFKIKLRSLNTPKMLYWLNVALVLTMLLAVGLGVWLWLLQITKLQYGEVYFNKGIESTWAIDATMMAKLCKVKLDHLQDYGLGKMPTDFYESAYSQISKYLTIYKNLLQEVLATHVLQTSEFLSMDGDLLRYMFQTVELVESSKGESVHPQVLEFLIKQSTLIRRDLIIYNPTEMQDLVHTHKRIFQDNVFYLALARMDLVIFLIITFTFLALCTVSMPIIFKIQSKVQEIIYLIDKISMNERKKYYSQFTLLYDELKFLSETDTWIGIDQTVDTKSKTVSNKISLMENSIKNSKGTREGDKLKGTLKGDQQSSQQKQIWSNLLQKMDSSFTKTIYFKILCLYAAFLFIFCAKFLHIEDSFQEFLKRDEVFTSSLTNKLEFTESMLSFEYQINQTEVSPDLLSQRAGSEPGVISNMYESYHLYQGKERYYQSYLQSLIASNTCQMINDNLQLANRNLNPQYLAELNLTSSELADCERLNNGSLLRGALSTLQYLESKRGELIAQELPLRLQFLESPVSAEMVQLMFYVNTLTFLNHFNAISEVKNEKEELLFLMWVWLIVLSATLACFLMVWAWIYLGVAEKASYINAFLLLIPYDVLSENPYIKLYIKSEFDYKSSVY